MMIEYKKITYRIVTLGILMMSLLLQSNTVFGQIRGNISGQTTANMGDIKTYVLFLSGFQGNPSYTWYTSGGSVVSQTQNRADIRFVDSGTVTITTVVQTVSGYHSYDLQVTVAANVTPPPNPKVNHIICNNASLIRVGSPNEGTTWYWQGKNPNGTSFTLGSNPGYTTNQGAGRYYIRAFDNNGNWSNSSGYVDVTIPLGQRPSITNVAANCGVTTLTRGNPPSGYTWYWQSEYNGTDDSNSSLHIDLTEGDGGEYYLRSRKNSTECWENADSSYYVILPLPSEPTIQSITKNCGNTILKRDTPFDGSTWYWQNNSNGTDTTNSSESIALTTGSLYYLRALGSNGCWSTKTIEYSVEPKPIWYADTDGDGLGDPNTILKQCTQPSGYVSNANDKCPGEFGEQQGCVFSPHELTLSNENYVFTRVYQEEMSSSNQIKYNKDVIENITYFDGLGRPKQQIGIKASPNVKDIVTHIPYDDYGRQNKQYLPFKRENTTTPLGSYKPVNIIDDINSYYKMTYGGDFTVAANHKDFNAYSESIFEPSPLNRVLEQGAPGAAWKANKDADTDHTIKFDWSTNTATEVFYFDVDFPLVNNMINTEAPTLAKDGYYTANELMVTITKDENWKPGQLYPNDHTTKEYTDKQGRVVLKRTYNKNIPHDTYYVYDDFGNLTYVIPPKVTLSATDGVSPEELSELCYQYKYDYRNRLVEKKIPGKGIESIVYDNLDRPVLTQDANQAAKSPKEWLFTKYDAFSRVAYTGILTDTRDRLAMQTEISAYTDQLWVERTAENTIGGASIFYNDQGWPNLNNAEVLTVQYYDDYELPPLMQSLNLVDNPAIYDVPLELNVKGLPTLSMTKVLTTDKWILSGIGYDKKGREIGLITRNNYLEYTDVIEMKLDFVGKVLESTTSHYNFYKPRIKTVDVFTYDHMGRLLKQTQKINDQDEELIAENSYDPLGQLISKKVGGTSTTLSASGLQDVNYQYNVRGWLKSINEGTTSNGDLFGFALDYTTGTNPLYNGNISATSWQTANDNVARSYAYTYDALNRITSGITNMPDQAYSLKDVKYDMMGNIKSLYRRGPQIQGSNAAVDIDILDYTYDQGNKLQSVTDNAPPSYGGFEDGNKTSNDYTYDDNGNMTVDKNKGITSITYNHLNLPETVSINNSEGTGDITYIYDATGAKLRKTAPGGGSLIETEYAGNYIYKNGNLEFFNHPEGYVEPNTLGGFDYIYQYKDHLGNIRLSYADKDNDGTIDIVRNDADVDGDGDLAHEILQEKNYYPFGLQHKGYNQTITGRDHEYGFGGKEEQDELGLAWVDITARNYDPAIGRWMNLDPLAEVMSYNSPYSYGFNNPTYFSDPTGLMPEGQGNGLGSEFTGYYDDGKGNVIYDPNVLGPGTTPKGGTYIGETYWNPDTGTFWDKYGFAHTQEEELEEVVIHSNPPLKGGYYNGTRFSRVRTGLDTGIFFSRRTTHTRKVEIPHNLFVGVEGTHAKLRDSESQRAKMLKLIAALLGVSDANILKGKVNLSEGALFGLYSYILGTNASMNVSKLNNIKDKYDDLGKTGNTKGVFAITQMTTQRIPENGGTVTHQITLSLYDVGSREYLGSIVNTY